MHPNSLKRLTLALLLSGSCTAALAQYVWLDGKGVKQYSDMPPPASVPNSRILKSPGALPQTAPPAADDNTNAETAKEEGSTPKGPPTLAEKNADFQKRRTEQAEKEKQAAEQAKQAAAKKKNCEQVGNYQRALQSGQRITRLSPTGERVYLTDNERANAMRENRQALSDCK